MKYVLRTSLMSSRLILSCFHRPKPPTPFQSAFVADDVSINILRTPLDLPCEVSRVACILSILNLAHRSVLQIAVLHSHPHCILHSEIDLILFYIVSAEYWGEEGDLKAPERPYEGQKGLRGFGRVVQASQRLVRPCSPSGGLLRPLSGLDTFGDVDQSSVREILNRTQALILNCESSPPYLLLFDAEDAWVFVTSGFVTLPSSGRNQGGVRHIVSIVHR
ncbi:hypothetical protein B0H16DRAFT_1467344 [Mycena metata]|uniref:Uncharacterized protein n=1 Tax=Mycena metata TaxID=1033252 RepID=A0AAD7I4Q0_9AGAR|nr:hypothetical protein B0H16DRAFT_1467344 [Mycena metata]